MARTESAQALVDKLELPFNALGQDPYGISRDALVRGLQLLGFFYQHYFDVHCHGLEHVPARGRGMLVGNHSGGYAVDGAMVLVSLMLEKEPPRLAQGMAERFLVRLPFFSQWTARTGQFTGLPENAERLLRDERLLLVFPEGARGTAKLFSERDSLVDFGTGFMRLALKTKSPILPFGFLGGGEAIPTIANLYRLGRLFGVPYIPVTPYVVPLPLPVRLDIVYGEPMLFEGTGSEEDEVVLAYVERVKRRIKELMHQGLVQQGKEARGP
ncbi:acyltransferase [Aggregicoccus sp. 17bor-14]|uniref:1-acyl-sn-glycerol-3-phosphate acyltransferase n=1 Tax=Myxococcaceae TaxID=31 RepID=UPI0012F14AF2|nr:1-acyl-sn-glycerol-3-phosphate acyltransferase [Simulacricoccus sp. 17bor-14]MRI90956.1 acyltransferase [Aggregicoccus sp. 17bor-14]